MILSPGRVAISRQIAGASLNATPNLSRLAPVEMCGWVIDSISGFTRSATVARWPRAVAIASIRSNSPTDSALIALRPRDTALAKSSVRFPTPVNTI